VKLTSPPSSSRDYIFRRFIEGCSRADDADAIVDHAVTLESLLTPQYEDVGNQQLSYRFRLHGAFYLAEEPSRRQDVWALLGEIYGVRSRLVHGITAKKQRPGKGYPTAEELQEARREITILAARGLLRAAREGFPSGEDLVQMILRVGAVVLGECS
jgi:Apea-like HEPN